MLTIALLVVEIWKALRRPRAPIVRKSSFRTQQRELQLQHQKQQPRQQYQKQPPTDLNLKTTTGTTSTSSSASTTPIERSPEKAALQEQEQQHNNSGGSSSARDGEKRAAVGRIPAPAKTIVPGVQPQVTAAPNSAQAVPPPVSKKPQEQPEPHSSHIPTPIQKNVNKNLEPVMADRFDSWFQKQMLQFQFSFNQADKDRSGQLTRDEVYNVLEEVGFKGTPEDASTIFASFDKDGSNVITKDEYKSAMEGLPKLTIRQFVLRTAFKRLDRDRNGVLSRDEIMMAYESIGVPMIESKKVDELVALSQKDRDGKVEYDEFLSALGLEEEATLMYRVFTTADQDGNGFLSREEIFNKISEEPELKFIQSKATELCAKMDANSEDKINYKDFLEIFRKTRKNRA